MPRARAWPQRIDDVALLSPAVLPSRGPVARRRAHGRLRRRGRQLEGLVSAFTSASQFSVDGRPVDARAAEFPDGTSGLGLGARVKAEGTIRAGVLVASRVRATTRGQDGGRDFEVRGSIASVDAIAKTFVVRRVVVSYAGAVDFRDGAAGDLAVGREVEARGRLSADGTRLLATRIDFRR